MDIERPDLQRRRRRQRFASLAIGGSLTLALLLGLSRLRAPVPEVARDSVWIEAVRRGEMLRDVRGQGTLQPRESRWIAALTSASVSRVLAHAGAAVSADTVLMELASPEVTEELDSARAAVAAARADSAARQMTLESQLLDLRASEAQLQAAKALAEAKLQAGRQLLQWGSIASLDVRQYELNAEEQQTLLQLAHERVAKFHATQAAQAAADRARLVQLEDALTLRERQVAALTVRAGTAGVLQSIAVQEGAQVSAGTNLARVAGVGAMRAELRVSETEVRDVLVGQSVTVDLHSALLDGRVERVDPSVLHNTVQVDVALLGPLPKEARPDLSVDGVIHIERLADVLYVARPAAVQTGATSSLFRVAADGRSAARALVHFGRTSSMFVEVLSGLSPGDRVILSDTSIWDSQDRLRLK